MTLHFVKDEKLRLFEAIADSLDIPPSDYKKAYKRYQSLGEWLHRENSKVAELDPQVYSQGSFRYGTVNRPLLKSDEYDLDLVCEVTLTKANRSQHDVKHLLGDEIKDYAEANKVKAPVVERNRCWRMDYADEVLFHIDALPCTPEDPETIGKICQQGVPRELAETSVAITDKRLPNYESISTDWPCSNPRGLGNWFEDQARPSATSRIQELVASRAYASIDKVPPYEWKSPLQRSIQILKRHRDVMFLEAPEFAPISMIITVLAAKAYGGEPSLYDALKGIVDRMPEHIKAQKPRIANPVNQNEDFADRWTEERHATNFDLWHQAIKADLENLPNLIGDKQLSAEVSRSFRVDLTDEQIRVISPPLAHAEPKAAPAVHIATAPKPWRQRD